MLFDGYSSEQEYKDMLFYFETNPNNKTCSDYDDKDYVLGRIKKRFGSEIPSKRLSYILMKYFHMDLHESQRFIRFCIDHGKIILNDRSWNKL